MLQGSVSNKTKQKHTHKKNQNPKTNQQTNEKKPHQRNTTIAFLRKLELLWWRETENCRHHYTCGICTMAALFLLWSVSQPSQEDLITYDLSLLKAASYIGIF